MSKYNHAFSLGFSLSNSDYENPDDALRYEQRAVISALLDRVKQLLADDHELIEACEPFDTYEEVKDHIAIKQCPECHRRFDLLDEADADEWTSGHDCEPTPNPSTAQCEKCGDQYEDGGWGDDGNCPRHRLS